MRKKLAVILLASTATNFSLTALAQTPSECFANPQLCSRPNTVSKAPPTPKKIVEPRATTPTSYDILRNAFNDLSPDKREAVQTILKNKGHYTSEIDGAFGRGTYTALERQLLGNLPRNSETAAILLNNILRETEEKPLVATNFDVEDAKLLIGDVEEFISKGIGRFPIEFAKYYQDVSRLKSGAYSFQLEQKYKIFRDFVMSDVNFATFKIAKDTERKESILNEIRITKNALSAHQIILRQWLQDNLIDSRSAQVFSILEKIDAALMSENLLEITNINITTESLIIQLGLNQVSQKENGDSKDQNYAAINNDIISDSVYIFGNFTGTARHIYKDFNGNIKMDEQKSDACIVSAIDPWQRYELYKTMVNNFGAKEYNMVKKCMDIEDIIVISGYDIKQQKSPNVLAQESYELIYEITKESAIKAKQEAELVSQVYERDILSKSKLGYGAIVYNQEPLTTCHLYSGEPQDHINALSEHEFLLKNVIGLNDEVIYAQDEIDAFQSVQRKKCGVVYANSDTLHTLLVASKNNSMDYFVAPFWISQIEIENIADQRIIEEQREAVLAKEIEQNEKLRAEAAKAVSQKASIIEKELQKRNKLRFQVLVDKLTPSLSEALSFSQSNSPLDVGYREKYSRLTSIDELSQSNVSVFEPIIADIQRLVLQGWEITSDSINKLDYGSVIYNQRNLEGLILRLTVSLRNRKIGAYDDACWKISTVWDDDFSVWRNVDVTECDTENLKWKLENKFSSEWLVK